jgi:hypothetical protein
MAKLIPPNPAATWCDSHGHHHKAGPDGTVEIPEIHVPSLLDAGWTRGPMPQPMPFIGPANDQKDLLFKFNALLAHLQNQGLMVGP